ncbi:DUF2018 family protein [uncultured Helicobacter sp.]|uniref:DUF2018 family protein n=1 Tax=uncultured Helicobacter sp. TaxID=175537 RepID=UPI0026315750|nr:DUF2018 family protein [uncultured Helicobacter sp.]
MFEELFEGSPIQKWKEIIFHANPSVVEAELERLLEDLAICELEKEGGELSFENIQKKKNDLAITSMSEILSKNE